VFKLQPRSATNIKGIDVSRWQGNIDWAKVAASGIEFAFIKATQGLAWVDPLLKQNAAGADKAGISIGYYHFAEPEKSATLQATHFAKTVSSLPQDLPLVLDIETEGALSRSEIYAFTSAFLKELERLTNRLPMIYTGAYFAEKHLGKDLSRYPLWVAHYENSPGSLKTPKANQTWSKWTIWQHTSTGSVPGIKGNVDLNVMEADFMPVIHSISKEDGEKLVGLLKALWTMEDSKFMDVSTYHGENVTKDDISKLADAVRAASGLPKE
jgi:GH25 family lysozyme M1 (1,4-beta-N-acetylmuramidase)